MTIFHWNPIRQPSDARNHRKYSNEPVTFVPRNYVRQRKHWLYNNLFVLLAGLWALTVSHDIDIFNTDAKLELKKIFASNSLCLSHLVAVPLIMWKLHLHYSIILGAVGMGVVPFFYYVRDPVILSVVICLRVIFEALFDVSATIYIIELAQICSNVQGNAIMSEMLTMRCLIMMFSCAANVTSIAWQRYTRHQDVPDDRRRCGKYICPRAFVERVRLAGSLSTLSTGQNTMFVAVAIVIALSGIILIAMYLKPIGSLGSTNPSKELRASNPWRIYKQFEKPKSVYLALLITTCVFMYGLNDEFVSVYVNCHRSMQNTYFTVIGRQMSIVFGVFTCVTLVDLIGCKWIYTMALCSQMLSYVCLVFWNSTNFNTEITYIVVYHVLCTSIGIEMSVVHVLVVQTMNDDEVSVACFFYVLGDIAHTLRLLCDMYFCTGTKLWISIVLSPIAMFSTFAYWHKIDEPFAHQTQCGSCSQTIKTGKETLDKSCSFDLKIVIENPNDIRKIETFMQRNYTLKSRYLVPPSDDVFSDA